MSFDKWYEVVKTHLGNHKKEKLRISEKGTFRGKDYDHILPIRNGERNYMCRAAETALDPQERHSYWHHLNSSQTLCVNYFAPLDHKKLGFLLSRLLNKTVEPRTSKFEYNPDPKGSHFDFFAEDKDKNRYFFEIKYTENDVTKNSKASNPSAIYKTLYAEDVGANPAFANVDEDSFMNRHFQAYRNMVKGVDCCYSVFITMRSNENTRTELESALRDLGSVTKDHVILLYWEEVIDTALCTFKEDPDLVQYYEEMKNKYLPVFDKDHTRCLCDLCRKRHEGLLFNN